jgi:hypothetical protein
MSKVWLNCNVTGHPNGFWSVTSKRQTKLPLNRDDLETLLSSKINIDYLRGGSRMSVFRTDCNYNYS